MLSWPTERIFLHHMGAKNSTQVVRLLWWACLPTKTSHLYDCGSYTWYPACCRSALTCAHGLCWVNAGSDFIQLLLFIVLLFTLLLQRKCYPQTGSLSPGKKAHIFPWRIDSLTLESMVITKLCRAWSSFAETLFSKQLEAILFSVNVKISCRTQHSHRTQGVMPSGSLISKKIQALLKCVNRLVWLLNMGSLFFLIVPQFTQAIWTILIALPFWDYATG